MSLSHAGPRLLQRAERLKRTKVTVDEAAGCWLWEGAKTAQGYGTVNVAVDGHRSNTTAHRFFYEVYVGPIPHGETVHHRCAVRLCVNPDHLEPISHRENTAEMFERRALNATIEHAEKTMEDMADALRDAYSQDHDHEGGE